MNSDKCQRSSFHSVLTTDPERLASSGSFAASSGGSEVFSIPNSLPMFTTSTNRFKDLEVTAEIFSQPQRRCDTWVVERIRKDLFCRDDMAQDTLKKFCGGNTELSSHVLNG